MVAQCLPDCEILRSRELYTRSEEFQYGGLTLNFWHWPWSLKVNNNVLTFATLNTCAKFYENRTCSIREIILSVTNERTNEPTNQPTNKRIHNIPSGWRYASYHNWCLAVTIGIPIPHPFSQSWDSGLGISNPWIPAGLWDPEDMIS